MPARGTWFVLAVVGAVAFAYWPTSKKAPAPKAAPAQSFASPVVQQPTTQRSTTAPSPSANVAKESAPKPKNSPTASKSATREKAEALLTSAAIAAIIVQASRQAYYATGKPCACPDDTMRNGRACGGRSAYSRPGGAAPLCSVTDVTPGMIAAYRERAARERVADR